MANPQNTAMEATPAYFIYRDIPAGQTFDVTAPLVFFPAKGSDELFDALRIAFPHLKSHSERMRDAIIQYLLQERQDEQLVEASPTTTMDPATATWPSVSSSGSASLLNSPETLNFATPGSFSNSPYQAPQLTRQASVATSGQSSPPSLDQMTGVFSLSTSSQPKQRVRRKMTEAEKAEYRKRRIVKACDKCAKRKRKCPHNQAQMETVSTRSGSKSSKTASPKSAKSAATPSSVNQESVPGGSFMTTDGAGGFVPEFDMNSFQSFDDFTMFDDQFPELDMDNLIQFDQPNAMFQPHNVFTPDFSPTQQTWPSNNSLHDFTLMDPQPGQGQFDLSTHTELFDQNTAFEQLPLESQIPQQSQAGLRVSRSARTTAQHSTHRNGGRTLDNAGGSANGMLWEHLRTGQSENPQPTHTAHVHGISSGGLFDLGESNGVLVEPGRKPTLPQTTLRLIGTKKAIDAFAGLGQGREHSSSTRQLVSMERVANLLRHVSEHDDGVKKALLHSGLEVHHTRPHQASSVLHDVNKRDSMLQQDSRWRERRHMRVRTNANPELGQQTSTSVSPSSGLQPAALPQGRPSASDLGKQPTTARSSVQTGGRFQRSSSSNHAGRIQPSLGEGITSSAGLSTEMYMLRRRIYQTPARTRLNANATGIRGSSVNPRNRTENHNLEAQANGGAYPRLETTTTPTSVSQDAFGKKASEIARAQGPASYPASSNPNVSFRSRTSTAADGDGHTDQIDVHVNVPTAKALTTDKGRVNIFSDSKTIDKRFSAMGNFSYGEERLSCHNTFRDHHGRDAAVTMVLGAAILLAGMLVAGFSPSVALLSLLTIGYGEESYGPIWRDFVQCSEKNSSWLVEKVANIPRKAPSAAFSGKKQKKDEDVGSKWVQGLMFPALIFAA